MCYLAYIDASTALSSYINPTRDVGLLAEIMAAQYLSYLIQYSEAMQDPVASGIPANSELIGNSMLYALNCTRGGGAACSTHHAKTLPDLYQRKVFNFALGKLREVFGSTETTLLQ